MGKNPVGQSGHISIDERYFPNFNAILHNPVLCDPPLCTLRELQDGTYSIDDLYMMNELIGLKIYIKNKSKKK